MDKVMVLQKLSDKCLTQVEAGEWLGVSDRHIRRMMRVWKAKGWEGFLPQPRPSNRKIKDDVKHKAMDLIKQHYHDFGPTLASEKLQENHGLHISKESIRRWMIEQELWKGKRRRSARIHPSRERRPRLGEMVQIDGSHHDWFEGRAPACCLLVMVDDATSQIVGMRFEPSETTFGYMRCIEEHILAYGRPISYYSDKHSIFRQNRDSIKVLKEEGHHTQLQRALKELRIELICAHSPQAKGRVERANGVLQDRLIKEMRLRGLSSMEEGNAYLREFMEGYNKRFGVEAASSEDAHRPWLPSVETLRLMLSKKYTRRLSKNLEFSLNRKIYQIEGQGQGYRLRHGEVLICETAYGETMVVYKGKFLRYKMLESSFKIEEADSKDIQRVMDQICEEQRQEIFTGFDSPCAPFALAREASSSTRAVHL